MLKVFIPFVVAFLLGLGVAQAEGLAKNDPLYIEAKTLDTKLFNAYNQCDLPQLEQLVSEELEFYHDQGGLMQGRAAFLAAIKAHICHKVERKLIDDSLEIFPLNGYGFIEKGLHTFCNKVETPVCHDASNGEGKFFMLWQKTDTGYRLTRVISFDHINSWQRHRKPEQSR